MIIYAYVRSNKQTVLPTRTYNTIFSFTASCYIIAIPASQYRKLQDFIQYPSVISNEKHHRFSETTVIENMTCVTHISIPSLERVNP